MPGFLQGPLTGFTDRAKGKGVVSSAWLAQIGRSAAQAAGGGNIYSGLSAAGVGNGADTTADTLYTGTIPANFFDVAGRCLTIQAFGSVAATSATKTIGFVWGGGSLSQSIVSYATTNGGFWQVFLQIFKVSANVQIALFQADASGTPATLLGLTGGRALAINIAGSEIDTAAIPFKITGQSSVATANLVTCNGCIVDGYN